MKHKINKTQHLTAIRDLVGKVDDRFTRAPPLHRIAAVLLMFVGCTQHGRVCAQDLCDAWEDLGAIGRVIRGDFCLRPVVAEDRWQVDAMVGDEGYSDYEDDGNDFFTQDRGTT